MIWCQRQALLFIVYIYNILYIEVAPRAMNAKNSESLTKPLCKNSISPNANSKKIPSTIFQPDCYHFFFFLILWPCSQHMELLGPGSESAADSICYLLNPLLLESSLSEYKRLCVYVYAQSLAQSQP